FPVALARRNGKIEHAVGIGLAGEPEVPPLALVSHESLPHHDVAQQRAVRLCRGADVPEGEVRARVETVEAGAEIDGAVLGALALRRRAGLERVRIVPAWRRRETERHEAEIDGRAARM